MDDTKLSKDIRSYINQIGEELNITGIQGVQGNELELIAVVRNCKYLYDKNITDFRNVPLKNETWRAIADFFNVPVAEVLLKWRNIRDNYTRYQKFAKSGDHKIKRFYYFDDLTFLDTYIDSCPKRRKYHKINQGKRKKEEDVDSDSAPQGDGETNIDENNMTSAQKIEYYMEKDELDYAFIEAVKSRPILYDQKYAMGKYACQKQEAWKVISEVLKLSEQKCAMKWKNFRDRYCRHVRATYTGQKVFFPYYDRMRFLDGHIKMRGQDFDVVPKSVAHTINSSTQESTKVESSNIYSESSLQTEEDLDDRDVKINDMIFVDTSQIPEQSDLSVHHFERTPNEDDLFGQTIAAELKLITDSRKKMKIKADIYRLLFEMTE